MVNKINPTDRFIPLNKHSKISSQPVSLFDRSLPLEELYNASLRRFYTACQVLDKIAKMPNEPSKVSVMRELMQVTSVLIIDADSLLKVYFSKLFEPDGQQGVN